MAAATAPQAAAAGWLAAFTFWSAIPIGCLLVLMIHRLTGGRWGDSLRPALAPAAAQVPLLFVLAVPVLVSIGILYPWSHGEGAKPDVLAGYLNVPLFLIRTVVALAGWSALAIVLPRLRRLAGQLAAALGLVFHGVIISLVAVDWMLSLAPPFISSSFGASVAICSSPPRWHSRRWPRRNGRTIRRRGDLGGLLLTSVLGLTYVDFMALLVVWYGDLPAKVSWFVARTELPWSALAAAAFLFGALIPILALLSSRVRNARSPLRIVGLSVLAGLAFYQAYLVIPRFGALALIPTLLAFTTIGLLLAGLALGDDAPAVRLARSIARGR